ncbi:uncharacterized protein LOC122318679 [Carya illinoinensis]|uniref:uncharacterized protein LOC122318679 n=1 Tax=Carya illinoinensis TaxID=32201 RepID=UPI001C71C95C|nr:uncharacterized protein LOC122318679 [Carya illinoinensis]
MKQARETLHFCKSRNSPGTCTAIKGLNLLPSSSISSFWRYEASGSSLLKRDPITISGEINAYDGGSNLSPLLHKYETSIEGSRASASEVSGEVVKLPTVSPIDQSSPASTLGLELNLEQQTQRRRLFTLNQISSAIAAAEGTRLFCSAIIAIFVMLSYLGFPLPGSYIIKSIISFRPLYIVLLTNATIVLTRLTFDKQRDFEWATRDESETPLNGYGWAE